MWMFFENGTFYSAVQEKNDENVKWVRTRDQRSAELLAEWATLERGKPVEILEWQKRDYAYRIRLTRDEWTRFVNFQLEMAQATNFKSEVAKNIGYTAGKRWLDALHDVWQVMFDLQWDLKYPKKSVKTPNDAEPEDLPPLDDDEAWANFDAWHQRNKLDK